MWIQQERERMKTGVVTMLTCFRCSPSTGATKKAPIQHVDKMVN